VPTIPPTVNAWLIFNPRPPGDWHETLESLVQKLVLQTALDKDAVVVEQITPKSSPKMVIQAPPLVGAFIGACAVSAGAAAATIMRITRDDRAHSAAYRHS
jgi:hypothetical protein